MADEVYVLNEGVVLPTDFTATPSAGTFNTATSTNPFVITTNNSYNTDENFNFYEVYDGEVSSFGGSVTPVNDSTTKQTNRQETPGYRVQLETNLANGFNFTATYHYYVLVYSDNIYKHHLAKFTEQTKYDGTVYNIDFTPRLKENIPVGTQVKIFRGPLITSSVVAVGYGLTNDPDPTSGTNNTDERHDKFVELSRPTFHFLSGNKLEPNRKYSIVKRIYEPTGPNNVDTHSFFKTAPLTSDYILDKSFYTQNATIVDNNKTLDNGSTPQLRNTSTGTGATYAFSTTTWNNSSRNIYYSDSGHTTYLGFIDSPVRNQLIPSAINIKTKKTITNRGNHFEAKFSDVTKFLDKKVNTNERVHVKEGIKRQDINYTPKATLYGTYNNHTDADKIEVTKLGEGQDLRTLLFNSTSSKYELILIGDYYYLPSAIAAPSSGSQVITVANRRAITSGAFEGSTTVASMTNATAFRKEWSAVVSNFITTHPIDTVIESGTLKRNGDTLTDSEADINGLEYRIDGEYYGFSITVQNGDSVNGYVTFSDSPSSSYYASTDLFSSLKGKLDVNKIIFEGRVETVEKKIENNLHFITLSGRDDIGKLLSKPVDKNYLYSRDYVYSTISPFTDTMTDTGLDFNNTPSDKNITTESSLSVSGTLGVALEYGDVLYMKINSKYLPVGVLSTSYATGSHTTLALLGDCFIDIHTDYHGGLSGYDGNVYVGKNYLIAGKSSDISLRGTSATSLYGSLDKGYRFKGTGKALSSTGVESSTIESLNGDGIEIDDLLITQGSSISRKDSPIGFGNTTQLVNGISTMEFLSSNINEETGLLDVEVGFISPLVLGRIDLNDNTFGESSSNPNVTPYDNAMGLYLVNKNGLSDGGFIHLLNSKNNVDSSTTLQYAPSTHKEITHDDRSASGSRINYAMRFGSPIFRLNNLSASVLRHYNTFENYTTVKDRIGKLYYENPSAYKFYGSVFRLSGTETLATDFYSQSVDDNLKSLPVEKKGYLPELGSTGHDISRFPTVFNNSIEHVGPRFRQFSSGGSEATTIAYNFKRDQENYDPSIVNAFLFSPGDMMPDSKKRLDNIFNSTISRNLRDYYLMVKYKSPLSENLLLHTSYQGSTKLVSTRETDYEFFPIESASAGATTITDLRRMNLLRLRSMTVDSLFNEVDFERYRTRTSFIGQRPLPGYTINSIPNHGISIYPCHTTSATSSSSATINVDNATGISVYSGTTGVYYNLYLYTNPADDSTGKSRFLGAVDGNSSKTTTQLTLKSNCFVDGYSGEIYVSSFDLHIPYAGSVGGQTVTEADVYLTGEDYIYPSATASSGKHNPNIHDINQFTVTLNNQPNFINRTYKINSELHSSAQTFRTHGAEHYSTEAEITFSGADTTTYANQTQITINFATLSTGSVAPDLTHYEAGDIIIIDGHATANKNTRYDIISKTSTSITARSKTLTASCLYGNATTTVGLLGGETVSSLFLNVGMTVTGTGIPANTTITSLGSADFVISNTPTVSPGTTGTLTFGATLTNDAVADSCTVLNYERYRFHNYSVGSRLLTDMGTPQNGTANLHDIYNDMGVVVAQNGGNSICSNSANARLYSAKLKNIQMHNNYGTKVSTSVSSAPRSLTTLNRYFADTNHYLGSADSGLEKDVAELLFIPRFDLSKLGISNVNALDSTSNYTDYGYLTVLVDFNFLRTPALSVNLSHWIHYIGNLAGKYVINTRTNKLHYVVNHEISKTETGNTIRHYVLIDNYASGEINGTDIFEVLTVCNQTTDPSKADYPLYEFDSMNVINPKTGKFYEQTEMERDYTATSVALTGATFTSNDAVVKGMFVVADVDGAGSGLLVHRDSTTMPFPLAYGYTACLTDGVNKLKTILDVVSELSNSSSAVKVLQFAEIGKFHGSVSIGEVLNLGVIGKINREVDYAKIVLPFDIQTEAEEIADDIISSIGLTYNKSQDYNTSEHKKYYIGSNFDGQDSFTAVNNVLDYKDLKLLVDGESFSIVSNETNKNYRSIELSEDSVDYNITSFKRDISLYDKFNSVVVIGDGVRGIAKNHSEIESDGSEKIKEIYDFSITGQKQADEKARKMLRVFSTLSNAIQVEVASDLPHIEPGQIISLKFEREGIFRGNYTVIEVFKESGYPTKLLLGEYSKDLSATLSLLLGETRNLQGRNKQVYKSYASPSISLQKTRIKFVKATITSGSAQSTVLGFGTTIGFDAGMGL